MSKVNRVLNTLEKGWACVAPNTLKIPNDA